MVVSRNLKFALIVFLFVTLALKAVFQGSSAFPSRQDQLKLLLGRLEAKGYTYGGLTDSVWTPRLTVFKGECLLFISAVSAEGSTEEFRRRTLQPKERLAFVFNGHVYHDRQPRWKPILLQQIYKLARAMQLNTEFPAVYAVNYFHECSPLEDVATASQSRNGSKTR